jgi:hypothetical protein
MATEVSGMSLTFINVSDIIQNMNRDIRIARDPIQLSPYEQRVQDRLYRIKLERANKEQKPSEKIKLRKLNRFLAIGAGISALALSTVGIKALNSGEQTRTIYTYSGEVATDTAERALKHTGNLDPTTQEINTAADVLAQENPDHAHGSGPSLTFDPEATLEYQPEDLTPQN